MKTVAKVDRVEKGWWQVIDTRTGKVVKPSLSSATKAAAYAEYYNQEIAKAEKKWEEFGNN